MQWFAQEAVFLSIVLAGTALSLAAAPDVTRYEGLISGEPALVAYWRLDGDCRDAKGALHGETRGGAAVFDKGPGGGKAVVLAQGRFLAMGDAPALDLTETTIELWFRPTFRPTVGYDPCLIAKRRASPITRFSVHVMRDYAALAVWNGETVVRFAPAGRPLRGGEWYHLAVTCTREKMQVYLDGLPCRPVGGKATFNFEARHLPFQIGSSAPEGAECFDGAIDEVAVYSEALSAADIERHMDAMATKRRLTPEQIAAEAEKEPRGREAAAKKRLAELMADDHLFSRGAARLYRGEHLGAIWLPVGGIGSGSIQIDGEAARPVWQIFNNMTQASVPNSFFAVRVKVGGGRAVVRALQSEAVGPFAAMKSLSFRGEYPFGWFTFHDADLPVEVSLETFNPLIPTDLRSSSIPCAIYNVTVRNPTGKPAEVSLLGAQQNAVGYTGSGSIKGRSFAGYGGNVNRVWRTGGATLLHLATEKPKTAPGFGDMVLAVLEGNATASAAWDDLESLAADLADDSALTGPEKTGPTPDGQTADGALAVAFYLEPGASRTVRFVLTWHFPNARHGDGAWGGAGNRYANWWSDARDVAREVIDQFDELSDRTRRFHDTLYATNLPVWLLDRLSSQLVVLRSQTTFWTRAGYFGGWEGCGRSHGCCHGNCSHVWQYAQSHARLFPALGRIMREQEFRHQVPDGGIPHRQPESHAAFDGQCGSILGAYREHLMSRDGDWLSRHWSNVKRAMDFLIARWDDDGDGVLAGPQWNTLDGNLGGSTSWLGTLYLASLAATERMAVLQGDTQAARRYRAIRESGSKKQDESLFNGEYYIQIPDAKPQQDYGRGCHIDQVLGQWWAWQLDLGSLYPPQRVRTALGSLFKHNFRPSLRGYRQVPRKFVADADPGMQMITWPKGNRLPEHMQYADEVMSGFEYSAAAAMVYAGLVREGFAIVRAASMRYDGRLRTGLTGADTASWGYSGNPFGDDECGKFYARPMSIWSMLLACQGYVYDGPAGLIGFKPVWKPEGHVSFFSAAEGWGLFAQKQSAGRQTERIEVRYGTLRVKSLVFELPEDVTPSKVAVRLGEEPLGATHAFRDRQLTLTLAAETTVREGEAITAVVQW